MSEPLYVIFDGPPGPESCRFVEVETADGRSVKAGEWEQYGDLYRLGPFHPAQAAAAEPSVPQGWRLVPVEPTQDMWLNGIMAFTGEIAGKDAVAIYRAMLAASPAAPEGDTLLMEHLCVHGIDRRSGTCRDCEAFNAADRAAAPEGETTCKCGKSPKECGQTACEAPAHTPAAGALFSEVEHAELVNEVARSIAAEMSHEHWPSLRPFAASLCVLVSQRLAAGPPPTAQPPQQTTAAIAANAMRVVVSCAEDYLNAVAALGKVKEGKTLFDHSPIKDEEAYNAWTALNDTGKRLRECVERLRPAITEEPTR